MARIKACHTLGNLLLALGLISRASGVSRACQPWIETPTSALARAERRGLVISLLRLPLRLPETT